MEYENKKLIEFEKFIKGKKVAIIGVGVSNLPLIDYFYEKRADVTIFDSKSLEQNILEKIEKYKMQYFCRRKIFRKITKFWFDFKKS